jgi:hypothetical protein
MTFSCFICGALALVVVDTQDSSNFISLDFVSQYNIYTKPTSRLVEVADGNSFPITAETIVTSLTTLCVI